MSLVQPTARIVSVGAGIVILALLALKYLGGHAVPQDTVVLPLLVVLLLGLVLSTRRSPR